MKPPFLVAKTITPSCRKGEQTEHRVLFALCFVNAMQEVQLKELNSIFFFFFLIKTISSFSYQVTNSHKFVSASSVLSVLSVLSSRLGMHPNCLFILVLSLSFSRPEQHRLQHGAPLHQSLPCIMPPCSSLLHLRRHHHHLIGAPWGFISFSHSWICSGSSSSHLWKCLWKNGILPRRPCLSPLFRIHSPYRVRKSRSHLSLCVEITCSRKKREEKRKAEKKERKLKRKS